MFKLLSKIMKASLVATLLSVTFVPATSAEETLIFATTNPGQISLNADFLHPWAARINEEGKGILQLDVRDGPVLANHTNFVDRVADDVVQVVWGMSVFAANSFPRTLVGTLPFMLDSAEQSSVAMWKVYERGLFDGEYGDIVPLIITGFPQSSIHTNGKEVKSLADLKGLKVIVSSPAFAKILEDVGAAPLSFPITEWYEALQRGTADATVTPFTAFPPFRLGEVTTHSFDAPLGTATGMVFMSRKRWNDLSPEAQALLMKHSGLEASRALGKWMDNQNEKVIAGLKAGGKHVINKPSAEELAEMKVKYGRPVQQGWAGYAPDGKAVLEGFLEELKAAK